MYKPIQSLVVLLIVTLSSGVMSAHVAAQKMKPDEVVAKHLAAIGPAEAITAAKTRIAVGDAKAISRTSAVRDITGISQFASEGDKVVLAMIFNSTGYPYEKAAFDGQKMTVALWETTGKRSALGDFLVSKDIIFKQGLIGGVLSSAWPLLNVAERGAKLSYSGLKKVDGRQVHELKYSPKKGGDLSISLFFDAETFQHVRSEYSYSVSARMGARPGSSVQGPATDTGSTTMNRYKLIEEFSDFKPEGQLTLPHTYKLRLTVDASQSLLLEWLMNLKQFSFNEPIDVQSFNVSVSK